MHYLLEGDPSKYVWSGWLPPKWAIEWSLNILTYQAGLLRFICAKVVVESNCWTPHWRLAVYLRFVWCWISYFCRYFFLKEGVLARTCPRMHRVQMTKVAVRLAHDACCDVLEPHAVSVAQKRSNWNRTTEGRYTCLNQLCQIRIESGTASQNPILSIVEVCGIFIVVSYSSCGFNGNHDQPPTTLWCARTAKEKYVLHHS